MIVLERVGILAVDSSRTRAYLHALRRNDLRPAWAILLNDGLPPGAHFPEVPYFDNLTPAGDSVRAEGIPYDLVPTSDVNAPAVVQAVEEAPVDVLIYSGPGGAILRKEILGTGKRFLHVHPGLVPQYRGSTTIYYSLLAEGTCGASAIFLDEKIDTGPVLGQFSYPPPADRTTLDYGYDPFIRSDLLIRILKQYETAGEFRVEDQSRAAGETFFIMHPVLRHITILSRRDCASNREDEVERTGMQYAKIDHTSSTLGI